MARKERESVIDSVQHILAISGQGFVISLSRETHNEKGVYYEKKDFM